MFFFLLLFLKCFVVLCAPLEMSPSSLQFHVEPFPQSDTQVSTKVKLKLVLFLPSSIAIFSYIPPFFHPFLLSHPSLSLPLLSPFPDSWAESCVWRECMLARCPWAACALVVWPQCYDNNSKRQTRDGALCGVSIIRQSGARPVHLLGCQHQARGCRNRWEMIGNTNTKTLGWMTLSLTVFPHSHKYTVMSLQTKLLSYTD